MSAPFRFKQFEIHQDRCAMKVGTDGVLLGAWCTADAASTILDIGSGSGLISLMLAQRTNAQITGVELDLNAFEQSMENAMASPWGNRIQFVHQAAQQFAEDESKTFGLIVSNPPYFHQSKKSPSEQRSLARHNDQLPLTTLIKIVDQLLDEKGVFALVLPYDQEEQLMNLTAKHHLYPKRKCLVKGRADLPAKRILLEFNRNPQDIKNETLIIETSERHRYTNAYLRLTKDFYLFA